MAKKRKHRGLKTSLLLLFLTFILVNVLTNNPLQRTMLTQASSLPTIWVDPPTVIDSGLTPGTSFTVDLNIADANIEENTDCYSYQICMVWDTAIVDIDDVVTFGDFLDVPRVGWWGELTMDAPAGQKVVNVTDGSKYVSGYDVLIEDDSNSEWNEVASVMGTKLTMKNNLVHTYTVAANGGAYPKPNITPTISIPPTRTRIIAGQTSQGPAPGVSGSGWLCTFEFHVLASGETALDIDAIPQGSFTFIINNLGETIGDDI